jgi:hypothetical protein
VKVAANCNHLSPICSFNKNGAEKEFGNMKWQTYGLDVGKEFVIDYLRDETL